MRTLHVITGLGAGGAEQQLRLLLRHLPVHSDVIALTHADAVARGLRADGVRVLDLGMRGNRDLTALPRLTRAIRAGRYDLVHTHLYRACVYGRIAARLAGVRTVLATEHSLGHTHIEGRPLTAGTRALYLATERLGSATVAVSGTIADRLRDWGVPSERVHTVPNGIDAARFRHDPAARAAARARLGIPHDAYVAGGVGRLVPGKRFDAAVRAVAALPDVHLLLVGDGPERAALARLARMMGVADRVHLVGERDGAVAPSAPARGTAPRGDTYGHTHGDAHGGTAGDPEGGRAAEIPALLAAMDVCVSPSTEEAFGLAVLEALAAGLPVIHVTCPAIDELPLADAPGAQRVGPSTPELTAALRAHAARGAQRLPVPPAVRRYAIERTADQLMSLYARLHAAATDPHAPPPAAPTHPPYPAPAPGRGARQRPWPARGTTPGGPPRTTDHHDLKDAKR
ncbi:glycosyltransferase [Streptomyces sp. 71268]|uniref:glycosyltransferase n=1 Tax=Streptomyces sp. 71268 TaxID=3002640 RepID=UPI0023F72985|nr:glycosyltransferase [Streptomyces sp. 71268]WEV24611.1 glycosyltransferase [Streptomyces sp. 71268]